MYSSNIFNCVLCKSRLLRILVYACVSEIIHITLLFDEEEVFLKGTLNPVPNSQILALKLKMLSLPLLSFVKSSFLI